MINSIPRDLLNEYFVESGTYHGDGVQHALTCGFKNVISIEIDQKLYEECQRRFANMANIKLYLGDSSQILYNCIKGIDSTMTFWLDGHSMDHNTQDVQNAGFPVMGELEQIQKHHLNTHTIMIDDLRIINDKPQFDSCGWKFFGEDEILKKMLEINPDYQIYRIDGVAPNDVLVAKIQ